MFPDVGEVNSAGFSSCEIIMGQILTWCKTQGAPLTSIELWISSSHGSGSKFSDIKLNIIYSMISLQISQPFRKPSFTLPQEKQSLYSPMLKLECNNNLSHATCKPVNPSGPGETVCPDQLFIAHLPADELGEILTVP